LCFYQLYLPVSLLSHEEIRNQTITITGFSKLYGLAGLRIGAVIAHNHNHFKLLMDTSLHNSNVALLFYHKWPPSALNECGYYLDNFVTHLTKVRTIIVDELNTIPVLIACLLMAVMLLLRILPKPRNQPRNL
jgi:aspartate/methionine/tyrosine aminotransferase